MEQKADCIFGTFPVLLSRSDQNIVNFYKEFKNTLFETESSHELNELTN
jgi:hypothetical protein